jgi:hypothetical protein
MLANGANMLAYGGQMVDIMRDQDILLILS